MTDRQIYCICWFAVLTLVNIAMFWVENPKISKVLLGFAIEITFLYAAFYGGTM